MNKRKHNNGRKLFGLSFSFNSQITFRGGEKVRDRIGGTPGPMGPPGPQGVQGLGGPSGKSAYETAVEGGFNGDEWRFNHALAEIAKRYFEPTTYGTPQSEPDRRGTTR